VFAFFGPQVRDRGRGTTASGRSHGLTSTPSTRRIPTTDLSRYADLAVKGV
jgi:hypothetical protein